MSGGGRQRAVRAGSRWIRRGDGLEVVVVLARKDPGGRHGLPTRWVAWVALGDRSRGGVEHEADFREQFAWAGGTCDPGLYKSQAELSARDGRRVR